eukprot:8609106-Karenia_brevis.AAC.3
MIAGSFAKLLPATNQCEQLQSSHRELIMTIMMTMLLSRRAGPQHANRYMCLSSSFGSLCDNETLFLMLYDEGLLEKIFLRAQPKAPFQTQSGHCACVRHTSRRQQIHDTYNCAQREIISMQ